MNIKHFIWLIESTHMHTKQPHLSFHINRKNKHPQAGMAHVNVGTYTMACQLCEQPGWCGKNSTAQMCSKNAKVKAVGARYS